MAIYRLSIEVLKGERESDTLKERLRAIDALVDLQDKVRGITGMIVYPAEDKAPWGVPIRPNTFNIDFDTNKVDEASADFLAMEIVQRFVSYGRY